MVTYQYGVLLVLLVLIGVGCVHVGKIFTDQGDIFCKIISGSVPSKMYSQNDQAIVIQSRSGRPLAIPKKHIENLKSLSKEDIPELAHTIYFATQIMTKHKDSAGRLYNQAYFHTGSRAGQTVPHLHMHMDFNRLEKKCLQGDEEIVEETDLVKIVQEDSTTLRAVSKVILPHLAKLDSNSSEQLARILFTASQVINKGFPSKHYVTSIHDAGDRGLDIVFSLR